MSKKTWLWWLLAGLWCAAALYYFSEPTLFFEGIVLYGLALVLTVAWLIRLVIALRGSERRLKSVVLVAEALTCCTVAAFCVMGGASGVRFQLSEPALTAYAKAPKESDKPLRVGLYIFRGVSVDKETGEVTFSLGGRFLDAVSFAYLPKGTPKNFGEVRYEPIQGHWYERVDSW